MTIHRINSYPRLEQLGPGSSLKAFSSVYCAVSIKKKRKCLTGKNSPWKIRIGITSYNSIIGQKVPVIFCVLKGYYINSITR